MFWKFGSTMVSTPNMRAAGFAALWMVVRLARWLVDTAPLNRWHMLVNGWHTGPTPFPKWFSAPHKLSYFFMYSWSTIHGRGAPLSCFPTPTELHLVVTVPGRVVGGVDHTSASFPHLQAVFQREAAWITFLWHGKLVTPHTHQRREADVWKEFWWNAVDFQWILLDTLSHGKDNGQWTRRLDRAPDECNSDETTEHSVALWHCVLVW